MGQGSMVAALAAAAGLLASQPLLLVSLRATDPYEQETRRLFMEWKTYRDVGEEKCRYGLFKDNCHIVVRLNATDARQNMYGLNQFGDLTNEEVRECCYPES